MGDPHLGSDDMDTRNVIPFLLHLGCSALAGCAKFSLAQNEKLRKGV
jgi:hypothetical protein